MKRLFYAEDKELRSGWRILRVFVLAIPAGIVLALLDSVLLIPGLGEYIPHLALLGGVLLELLIRRKPLTYIGWNFRERGFWTDFLVGIVWGVGSILLVAAGMLIVTKELSWDQIGNELAEIDWVRMLSFWLVVALAEESLMRGYILSALRERMGIAPALVISAAIFSALHLGNPEYYWFAFLYAFLIGIIFGGVVVRRGNLGGVIGFHYLFNLLQDQGLLDMPAQGGELVFTVVLLLNLGLVYWLLPSRAAGPPSDQNITDTVAVESPRL